MADSDAANAFSVGRDPSQAALVVTRGLLTTLNRVELEGVLAHELNHIWSWGARLATLGVALGRVPGLLRLLAPARREFDADEGGARLTRYPPGLVSALRKLDRGQPAARPAGPAPPVDHGSRGRISPAGGRADRRPARAVRGRVSPVRSGSEVRARTGPSTARIST